MKKAFRLTGLCCANCAAKIERMVGKLEGVSEANVNFMTTKLNIECDEAKEEQTVVDIVAIVKKIEPDVVVVKA